VDGLNMKIGDRQVVYLRAGQPASVDEPIGNFDELEDRLLAEHPRMRRILVRLMPKWPLSCLYLHWSDGTDLDVLDELVAAGSAGEEDFSGAVAGQTGGMTCLKCQAKLRVITLGVTETALLFASDNVARTQRHAYRTACAVCGERWAASVLEFINVVIS
jgi:hypothetical protein